MLEAIEEFKREATRQGTNEGLAAARARGVRLGRPQTVDCEARSDSGLAA
jgi:DNA invertase Pin-like site-specific DNA recombinase